MARYQPSNWKDNEMSSETITTLRLTCDRCNFTADYSGPSNPERAWINMNGQHKDGSSYLPDGYKTELCPSCANDFNNWYRSVKRVQP